MKSIIATRAATRVQIVWACGAATIKNYLTVGEVMKHETVHTIATIITHTLLGGTFLAVLYWLIVIIDEMVNGL